MARRIGVLPVTVRNMPRRTQLTTKWFIQVMDVVTTYWREMSGGNEVIICRVFDWTVLPFTLEEKARLGGRELAARARDAVGRRHRYDLSSNVFDHVLVVLDDGISTSGFTPKGMDALIGSDINPALVMHEMGHMFQNRGEADLQAWPTPVQYGNSFDVMGAESSKFRYEEPHCVFEDPATGEAEAGRSLTGPGMGAPYLAAAGWLDLADPTVTHDLSAALNSPSGASGVVLRALRGAPGSSRIRIAIRCCAIADGVTTTGDRLFLEYRAAPGTPAPEDAPPTERWDRRMPAVPGAHGWILAHAMTMGGGSSRLVAALPALKGMATSVRGTLLRLHVEGVSRAADEPSAAQVGLHDAGDWRNAAWATDLAGTGRAQTLVHLSVEGQWWLGTTDGTSRWDLAAETAGFGNVLDDRHWVWLADFAGTGRSQVMMYHAGDGRWWLGRLRDSVLAWSTVSESAGYGDLLDSLHLLTVGRFTGARAQVLFYFAGDGRWWLGELSAGRLEWRTIGESRGFGNLLDERHRVWFGDFTGRGRTEVLFYFSGDGAWWHGALAAGSIAWTKVAERPGFGDLLDERHRVWFGDFTGRGRTEVLFYFSGDGAWWHGALAAGSIAWTKVAERPGFGDLLDERHRVWFGDFTGRGRTEVLFYFSGDGAWWHGALAAGSIAWTKVAERPGFGDLLDERHRVWFGDFTGRGRTEVLFYFSGDGAWWHGALAAGSIAWTKVAERPGFGDLLDENHEIWTGDFSGARRTEIMFFNRTDGNLWLGTHSPGKLTWTMVSQDRCFGASSWWAIR